MIDAISSALDTLDRNGKSLWGTQNNPVLLRRCIFHLLHLNFETEYRNFATDGGVGYKVRDWLKQAAQRALTKEQLLSAIQKILEYVEGVDTALFTNSARECLLEWVRARSRHIADWARYCCAFVKSHVTVCVSESTHQSSSELGPQARKQCGGCEKK